MVIHRIGTFFILVGIGLISLYILSDMAGTPTCNLLFIGILLLGLGIFLWFRNPLPKPPPSGRFRILKGVKKKKDNE